MPRFQEGGSDAGRRLTGRPDRFLTYAPVKLEYLINRYAVEVQGDSACSTVTLSAGARSAAIGC